VRSGCHSACQEPAGRSCSGAAAAASTEPRAGSCRAGLRYATASLRLGTLDPQLLYHAAAVEACAGRTIAARKHVHQALALNPEFAPLDGPRAMALAARLATEVGTAVDLDDLPGDVARLG